MSGTQCRKLKCSSKKCNQACAKEGCSLVCRGKQCHQVCTAPGGRCKMTCHPGVEKCVQLCPNGGCVTECHAKKCIQLSQTIPSWNVTTSPHPYVSTRSSAVTHGPSPQGRENMERSDTEGDDSDVIESFTVNQLTTDSDDVKWPTEYSIVRRVSPQKVRKEKNTSNKLCCSYSYILVALLPLFAKIL